MPFENLNNALDNIATGEWAVNFSPNSVKTIISLCVVLIFLCVFLDIILKYHERRGHFTHPTAHPEQHIGDIAHLINAVLKQLYDKQHLSGPGVRPSDVMFRKAGFLSSRVWRFHLNPPSDVAHGNFGRIVLNMHFFAERLRRHRYAMNIAAQLFYFQRLAMSGKDPREIQHNNSAIKKGGDIVLAQAGLLDAANSLKDGVTFGLIRHDRKVDERIAQALDLADSDAKGIEGALKGKVVSASSDRERMLHWISNEISHIKHLLELMADKKRTMDRLLAEEKKVSQETWRLKGIIDQWELDMTRIRWIADALEKIRESRDRWSFGMSSLHNFERRRKCDLSDAAGKLDIESVKGTININRVQSIVTSFTAERGRIIQLMQEEEAAV
ncbi:hypothetical protein JW898_05905 [Candidatus Woesearchaeota archaeon]|nr:hypothetical protein [Candidatus Woesearchaeota archaeon]